MPSSVGPYVQGIARLSGYELLLLLNVAWFYTCQFFNTELSSILMQKCCIISTKDTNSTFSRHLWHKKCGALASRNIHMCLKLYTIIVRHLIVRNKWEVACRPTNFQKLTRSPHFLVPLPKSHKSNEKIFGVIVGSSGSMVAVVGGGPCTGDSTSSSQSRAPLLRGAPLRPMTTRFWLRRVLHVYFLSFSGS